MSFYKLNHNGRDIKVLIANSKYEALGMYLSIHDELCTQEVEVEEMSAVEKIEVSCVGFPVYKTLNELHEERKIKYIPSVICELIE